MYLTRDKYNNVNNQLQGKAGDEVDVVAEHGDVFIVQPRKGGLSFSIRAEFLTEDKAKVEVGNWAPEVNVIPAKKQAGKKQQVITQSLF